MRFASSGPALTGELAPLRWGMTAAKIAKVAPQLASAIEVREYKQATRRRGAPLPFAGGTMQLVVYQTGLAMIELRYASRDDAHRALAAWGTPVAPPSELHMEFWTNATARTRAALMPNDKDPGVRVSLEPFVPLADMIATLLIGHDGKPLLGRTHAAMCMFSRAGGITYLTPATETSMGAHMLEVTWNKANRLSALRITLDYQAESVRAEILKLLEKHFGKPVPWTKSAPRLPNCGGYGNDPTIYACEGKLVMKVFTLFIGSDPSTN
jgi:hypothetical protein